MLYTAASKYIKAFLCALVSRCKFPFQPCLSICPSVLSFICLQFLLWFPLICPHAQLRRTYLIHKPHELSFLFDGGPFEAVKRLITSQKFHSWMGILEKCFPAYHRQITHQRLGVWKITFPLTAMPAGSFSEWNGFLGLRTTSCQSNVWNSAVTLCLQSHSKVPIILQISKHSQVDFLQHE